MSSPQFPEPPPSVPATPKNQLDDQLATLEKNKAAWGKLPIPDRIRFLTKCLDRTVALTPRWGDAIAAAAGIEPDDLASGELWLGGPITVASNLRLLIDTLEHGGQRPPARWFQKNGQDIARVYPLTPLDKLIFPVTADVWLEPGKPRTQGRIYREKDTSARVSLVLAAGNVASIGPADVLYKLFVDNDVVIAKMNPVNEYNGPFLEEAFKPLIDAGYLAVAYGGAEVGKYLCNHELIDNIHITGSEKTFDAIVWGATPEEQAKNKAAGTPVNDKPISSELGCVSPVFVVPGEWSDKELEFQAAHAASTVTHSASFACAAGKVVLLAKGWKQRDQFVEAFHAELKKARQRKAFYPGAQQRYDGFLERYPEAIAFGERSEEVVPWTAIPDVKPSREEYACSNEAFCGVVAEADIEATTAEEYLKEALRVANDELWGSLSCTVLIDPRTEKANQASFDAFIAELRYGGIGINLWGGVIFAFMAATWGAFPGNTREDIRSGQGTVHNTLLIDHPQKTVMRAPFVMRPKPVWFHSHANLRGVAKKLIHMQAYPSMLKLPGLLAQALKG